MLHVGINRFCYRMETRSTSKATTCWEWQKNVCRNLHTLLRRNGGVFPVEIDVAPATIARRRPFYHTSQVRWPVLKMSSWVKALLNKAPQMILAGHRVEDTSGWQSTFSSFWTRYKSVNGSHDIFSDGYDQRFVVPYFLHGDEGRGQCRRPFMVESFQPCISWKGSDVTNESG